MPETLSPSKMDRFTSCPLSFRYTYIDKIPEPLTQAQVKGTLTHKVLELLYAKEPELRTEEVAIEILDSVVSQESSSLEEVTGDEQEAESLVLEIGSLLHSYFVIEDPSAIHCRATELDITGEIAGFKLRGIIDRLDLTEKNDLAIVDYKTGKAPGESFEKSKLNAVSIYALLCELQFGQRPVEMRLVYLKNRISIIKLPTEQVMRATKSKIAAVAMAIQKACENDDFRARPSRLCPYCPHHNICPAFAHAADNTPKTPFK
ncbi:MAG: PD-(D/E)XK nuclease family protein [Firmicutes bacterium]|jgi:putative RecB family exonuclease|nr:PD-(D/E)XK nuclease family protein [Bacillota bacterium]